MKFPFYIARRYLFAKKRMGAINIISAISVGGIALATTAMVCVLSGFNGFRDLIGNLYTAFDPQLVVEPVADKFCAQDDPVLQEIRKHPQVASATDCLEDNALILFKGHPLVITLKGVGDNFSQTTDIGSILYSAKAGPSEFKLHQAELDYGTPGIGLANQFGTIDYGSLQICAPRKGERINLNNPAESFNVEEIQSPGVCFHVHQKKYDENYLIVPLHFVQNLYEQNGLLTKLELRLKDGADEERVEAELQQTAGQRYVVKNRMEQQEDTFKIMNIEKMFAFFFLTFIVLVACFNIIGNVSMLIIDKREDVKTLRFLGASDADIVGIFQGEGRIIAFAGATIGLVVGIVLVLVQQQFGIIKLGNSAGSFIVDAYPVSLHAIDLIVIYVTVIAVSFLSVWYPVRYLSKRLL